MTFAQDPTRKIALIHGYSDSGKSFEAWAGKLADRRVQAAVINICNYISLNNEVTIPDIAEGLSRAIKALGWADDEPFDAIVHSTGMLVIRAYLCNNPARSRNLKHLIGLAPATWGSPLAANGRSWLGSIVKGNKQFGPDFLNAGDGVLDGLELGSKFTWDLAERDLLHRNPDSPYVAVFIGNQPYGGIHELMDQSGTDGVVRWAGCALNTRKITVDLRKPDNTATISAWESERPDVPMFAVEGKNHSSLLRQPEDDLADSIVSFLNIDSADELVRWQNDTKARTAPALEKMKQDEGGPNDGWQQFVTRVVDQYGYSVPDYVVDLFKSDPRGLEGDQLQALDVRNFDLDVHSYKADPSFRCFHVSLPVGTTTNGAGSLWMRLTASSGTNMIAYQGFGTGTTNLVDSPAMLNISRLGLFYPFTTTLVEIHINREPLPFAGQTELLTMRPLNTDY